MAQGHAQPGEDVNATLCEGTEIKEACGGAPDACQEPPCSGAQQDEESELDGQQGENVNSPECEEHDKEIGSKKKNKKCCYVSDWGMGCLRSLQNCS